MVNDLKKLLGKLEKYLYERVFVNFTQLPGYIERPIAKYLPLLSIALGLLCLLDTYNLWHAAHNVNSLLGYANTYGNLYGIPRTSVDHHMSLAFWLAIITLLFEAYLFFKASSLVAKSLKAGWELIYYAFVVNVVYGIIMLFSFYGGIGTLLERFLFSFVCLYVLFEIRDAFTTKNTIKKKKKAKAA
jgi:hypothetical protein